MPGVPGFKIPSLHITAVYITQKLLIFSVQLLGLIASVVAVFTLSLWENKKKFKCFSSQLPLMDGCAYNHEQH